jgi:hypothetical protein
MIKLRVCSEFLLSVTAENLVKNDVAVMLSEAPRHKAYVRVVLDLHEFLNLALSGGK